MVYYYKFPIVGDLSIYITDKALAEFTKRQLGNYFVKEEKNLIKRNSPIEIIYQNEECSNSLNDYIEIVKSLSRKCYCTDGKAVIEDFIYETKGNAVHIYLKPQRKIKKLRSILKKIYYLTFGNSREKKYRSIHSEYYRYVFFPICSLYTIMGGFYCIHGSLLEINSHNIIISGLDGVGKSSIGNLLESKGYGRILSDNCVLYNGEYAVPMNCTMRLCYSETIEYPIIYRAKEFVEVLPTTVLTTPCKVEKIFNISVGKELKVSKLNERYNTEFVLYLCGASEINRANKFLSPFLYIYMQNERKINERKMDLIDVKIPYGEIEEGVKVIIDECTVFI